MARTVSLDAYSLLTFAELQAINGDLSKIGESVGNDLINKSTKVIESWAGRKIKARPYWKQIFRNQKTLFLNTPIQHITGIWDSFQQIQTTGSATASGSTTSLTDTTTLSQAADYWNGASIQILTGTNVWDGSVVSDFASGVCTISPAIDNAVASGDYYQLNLIDTSVGTEINYLTWNNIDFERGIVELGGRYSVAVVDYYAGYNTIPDVVKHACALQVKAMILHMETGGFAAVSIDGKTLEQDKRNPFIHISPIAMSMLGSYKSYCY